MSKRLKLVSVRLKPDREVYKNATFATATDVAFLMAKEIAAKKWIKNVKDRGNRSNETDRNNDSCAAAGKVFE